MYFLPRKMQREKRSLLMFYNKLENKKKDMEKYQVEVTWHSQLRAST